MEKKRKKHFPPEWDMLKIVRKMKLTVVFTLLVVMTFGNSYSQETNLSFNLKNADIKQVLQEIEDQSNYIFLYRDEIFDLSQKYSIDLQTKSIEDILELLSEQAKIDYEIRNRQIILKSKSVSISNQVKKIKLTGKVTDTSGQPLPGVTVVVKGTTNGTITNFDGIYSLSDVPSDGTIQFSFVGMKMQEISVGGKTSIDIVMEEDAIGIEEVVAVGYGTMKRSDITGSVSSIQSDDILKSKSNSVLGSIQGKLAGVRISSASGEPGASSNISIRGGNSVYGSSAPLFVIDGMPMDLNSDEVATTGIGNGDTYDPMSFLNPSDIESIEVLKDASATAIYGSRGANGVVMITTKSGKQGRLTINYDGYVGVSSLSKKLEVLSAEEYVDYMSENNPFSPLFYSDSNGDNVIDETDSPKDPFSLPFHDWQDETLRTAISHSHNLLISSGTDKTNYLGSLGYMDQQGIVINNGMQRYNARLKINHQQSNKLNMGINLTMSYAELNGSAISGGGSNYTGVVQNLVIARPIEFYDPNRDLETNYVSPITMLTDVYKTNGTTRNTMNAFFEYKIIDGLKINISVGGNLSNSKDKAFFGKETIWGNNYNGRAILSQNNTYSWFNTNRIDYQKKYGHHSINLMGAFEVNKYNNEFMLVENTDFPNETTGVDDISKGANIKRLLSNRWATKRLSYLGRINYSFKNRYLVTASYRIDGSDKFGPGNRYGFFPSFALAWRASEESFIKQIDKISNLKLRLSFGETGNERIPAYQYYPEMENSAYNNSFGLAPSSAGNPDLKWETTIQYDAGIDLGLFEGRIDVMADYYIKQTNDMLLSSYISSQTGYSTQWQNLGRVDNEGFEVQLTTKNISSRNFKWTTNFSFSTNKNTVVDLGDVDFIPVIMKGGWIQNVGRVIEGESLGTAYGYVWDGVYQIDDFTWQNDSDPTIPHDERTYVLKEDVVSVKNTTVTPGSFKFKNFDDDNMVTEEDQQVISHSSPRHFGGILNNFQYKNIELDFFLEWSKGNQIFNESRYRMEGAFPVVYMNILKDIYENHWTPENPSNEYGNYANLNKTASFTSSYYVEDASWLRLKNVTLSYTVLKQKIKSIGLSGLKFYVTGNNLITWTKYKGYDPELSSNNPLLPGFDRISYPRSKTIIFGVNVTF